MRLASVSTSVTYSFSGDQQFGWANCTINDALGELSIQSDWGSWSYRWCAHPSSLGAPTLTAFIARGDVDYLARKLNGRGTRWSPDGTVKALRKLLCARRLADGREQLANRLEPDDMPEGKPLSYLGGRYTDDGLPLYSDRRAPTPSLTDPHRTEPLLYLWPDGARRLWRLIDDAYGLHSDAFCDHLLRDESFRDYVTEEPWSYAVNEQTPEDRALREVILPALIAACNESLTASVQHATSQTAG